ncbi:hypothetical protein GW17_00017912 [Ensete ventricosum]|nr:hypothetical protein GW17_00017912 [Ensete ventricosum]
MHGGREARPHLCLRRRCREARLAFARGPASVPLATRLVDEQEKRSRLAMGLYSFPAMDLLLDVSPLGTSKVGTHLHTTCRSPPLLSQLTSMASIRGANHITANNNPLLACGHHYTMEVWKLKTLHCSRHEGRETQPSRLRSPPHCGGHEA